MSNKSGLKVTEEEISQTIDLEKLTGVSVGDDPTLVREIGQALIDKMQSRVEAGRGIGGVKLHSPYSDSYAGSLEFKAAGKTKNRVNMRLTGDMMGTIDMEDNGAQIKISIAEDQTLKAYGHITGFKGHPVLDGEVEPRPFFGMSKDEIKEVLNEFKGDLVNITKRTADTQGEAIKAIRKLKDLISVEEEK